MAISLDFHLNSRLGSHSDTECEEGKRAFWLYYIMDKQVPTRYNPPVVKLIQESLYQSRPLKGIRRHSSSRSTSTFLSCELVRLHLHQRRCAISPQYDSNARSGHNAQLGLHLRSREHLQSPLIGL